MNEMELRNDRRLRTVSTDGQSLDAQHSALTSAGAERVFAEKIADQDRPRCTGPLLRSLAPGDVLLVTKFDRLARSTLDLLNTLAAIDEARAGFRSLGDPWADSTYPTWQADAHGPWRLRRV